MIRIHKKFEPLIQQKTRYYIITGERGSSKSFTVNLFLTRLAGLNNDNIILFTRYTLESAKDSIIPEFKEKIMLNNMEGYFDVQLRDIYATKTNSKIMFRGIKTSQGIQTAKLKSLTDVNIWVIDEAEELPDEETFETINKSVRSAKNRNMVIMILNPAYKNHWIYKRFFDGRVADDFNGELDGVTYINMTFDDNKHNLDQEFVNEMELLRSTDYDRFRKVMAVNWKDEDEAIVFSIGKLKRFTEVDLTNAQIVAYCDIADQGTDFLCFVVGALIGDNIFIIDTVFTQADSNYTIPKIISLLEKYKVSLAWFESNAMGLAYTKMLKMQYEGTCKIIAYPNTQQKHSRIVIQADYILDQFHFKHADRNTEYYNYINQLTAYRNDKKSDFDDAADATAGLSYQIRRTLKK